jgi:hypothetical protein
MSASLVWDPLSVPEIAEMMRGLTVPWWIAGGWALDLFLGRQTRPHEDTDVQILRRDQLAVQRHLAGWDLHKTHQPGLARWPAGEVLAPPVNSFWARRGNGPWSFMVLLLEADGDEWVYRRCGSIRGPISGLGLTTPSGVPYLRPEIQLLFKGGGQLREKDTLDLLAVLPHLSPAAGVWLRNGLTAQFPDGHPWVGLLETLTT